MSVLAIDAGTTGVTALIVTADGSVSGRGYAEFSQYFPQPGWVEQMPEEIWQATLASCAQALAAGGADQVSCVGITNQRETAVIWDASTLIAPHRAIVWQDRRTASICAELRDAGHEDRVAELTGLRIDPYFTATKLTWLSRHAPEVWAGVADRSLAVGTVDSYLIARLTGGRRHVTDASNASRTLLFDIAAGQWSAELCSLFGVPPHALPEVTASTGEIGQTDPEAFLGLSVPIAGVAGDQQAALFGQACFAAGDSKCTYGTGSFVLANTGSTIVRSQAGLVSTVAWMDGSGTLTYALEGSVFVTGRGDPVAAGRARPARPRCGQRRARAVGARLRRRRLRPRADRARRAGLGPGREGRDPGADQGHDARAPGQGHARGDRVRGARCRRRDGGRRQTRVGRCVCWRQCASPAALRVDGGAAANDLLMQIQADQLQQPVERPVVAETTAIGAAFLAGLATGVWSSRDELAATWQLDRRFEPGARDDSAHKRWREAVRRSLGWASFTEAAGPG